MNLFQVDAYGNLSPSLPSHADDPESSRLAAKSHAPKANKNAAIVLELVRQNPGKTAVELFHLADSETQKQFTDFYEVRRRLSDLRTRGLVTTVVMRKCLHTGNSSMTWRVM